MTTQEEQQEVSFHHVITVKDLDGLKKEINITYDVEGVKEVMDTATKSVGKQVQIKGFRKGKAPLQLVKNWCKSQIELTAQSMLCQKGYMHACNEHSLFLLKDPEFNDPGFNTDGTFTCTVDVEVRPTIEPAGYVGMQLEKVPVDAEPMYEQFLKEMKSQNMIDVPVDEVKEKGVAVVDFSVFVGDEEINSGVAQPFVIMKGQDPPFGENLIGVKVGDVIDVTTVLNKDIKKHGGKKAIVKVTLKSAIEKREPTEDELVKNTKAPSYEELLKVIRNRAEKEAVAQEIRNIEEQAIDKLLETHSFNVPNDWVDDEYNNALQQFGLQKAPDEKTAKVVRDMAIRNVKRTFILEAIYREEPNAKVTQEHWKELIQAEADAHGVSPLVIKKEWEEKGMQASVGAHLMHRNVMQFILSGAQITTKGDSNTGEEVPSTDDIVIPETPFDE